MTHSEHSQLAGLLALYWAFLALNSSVAYLFDVNLLAALLGRDSIYFTLSHLLAFAGAWRAIPEHLNSALGGGS